MSWWPLIAAVFGIIAWGFRLEGKVRMNAQSISALEVELGKITAEVATHAVTTVQLARLEERVTALVSRTKEQNDTLREIFQLIRSPQIPPVL